MVDRAAALAWVRNPPSRRERALYALLRFGHHAIPNMLAVPLTFAGISSFLLKLIASIGIITAPFWIDVLAKGSMPTATAIVLSVVMLLLQFMSWAAPKLRSLGKAQEDRRIEQDKFATRHFVIVKDLFASLSSDCLPVSHEWRMRSADRVLSCILQLASSSLGVPADRLQATLLGFEGADPINLKILARAKTDRALNVLIRADKTIAYFAAICGKYFVVNDLKWQKIFSQKGLSKDKAGYRSILLIPVVLHHNEVRRCVALITIDSTRPSEFWGTAGDSLVTQLMPFVHMFTVLMGSAYPTVLIEEERL